MFILIMKSVKCVNTSFLISSKKIIFLCMFLHWVKVNTEQYHYPVKLASVPKLACRILKKSHIGQKYKQYTVSILQETLGF